MPRPPRAVRKPGRVRISWKVAYRRRRRTASPGEPQPSVTPHDVHLAPVERRLPVRQTPAMVSVPPPLAFCLLLFSGWVNRHQQAVIDYLLEENRILRAANGSRRLRLTDDQRRRLAVKGKALGRRQLAAIAGIVTPGTILRWYRRLVAQQYDGTTSRRPGRPPTKPDIAALVVRIATENPT